jgi:hypothetical protein
MFIRQEFRSQELQELQNRNQKKDQSLTTDYTDH